MSSSDRAPHGLAGHLQSQDWGRLRAEVLRFAFHLTRSRHAAEDLVQEAITRAIDPEGGPWNPDVEPRLAKHVMRIVDKIRRDDRDKRRVRLDLRNQAAVEERMSPRAVVPEDAVLAAEREAQARQRLEDVKAALWDDPLALQVVELSERGVDRPSDQAEATGAVVDDVLNARKRVRRAIASVLRREQPAESAPARKAAR